MMTVKFNKKNIVVETNERGKFHSEKERWMMNTEEAVKELKELKESGVTDEEFLNALDKSDYRYIVDLTVDNFGRKLEKYNK